MEKKCKKCGKVLPEEMFYNSGEYKRNVCKECTYKQKAEWKKNNPKSNEYRAKDNLRCALKRESYKAETGLSYRNDKEKERQRAYTAKYENEHKDDPKCIERHRRCGKNYRERRKIRTEVEELGEFFSNDFSFDCL